MNKYRNMNTKRVEELVKVVRAGVRLNREEGMPIEYRREMVEELVKVVRAGVRLKREEEGMPIEYRREMVDKRMRSTMKSILRVSRNIWLRE